MRREGAAEPAGGRRGSALPTCDTAFAINKGVTGGRCNDDRCIACNRIGSLIMHERILSNRHVVSRLVAVGVACVLGAPVCLDSVQADDVRWLGRVAARELAEVSGLVASWRNSDVVWIHDDGKIRDVYAVRFNGQVVARVQLPEKLTDCEDIAVGPGPVAGTTYLYLGDIGDNDNQRPYVCVFRVAEPDLSQVLPGVTFVPEVVEEFRMTYPDGPCDAEALMVDPETGDILIATKEKRTSRLFIARAARLRPGTTMPLKELGRIPAREVSAGDIARDGRRILLRREQNGWLWERASGEDLATAMTRRPREVPVLGTLQARNGEAVGFHASGQAYLTVSEGLHESIYAFRIKIRE
jgi:hypothetical protein